MAVAVSPVTEGKGFDVCHPVLDHKSQYSGTMDDCAVLMVTLKHRGPLVVPWELHQALTTAICVLITAWSAVLNTHVCLLGTHPGYPCLSECFPLPALCTLSGWPLPFDPQPK